MNSVATAEGVHLVGRVVSVGPRTCIVKLITDKSAGPIDGVIMSGDDVRGPKAAASSGRGRTLADACAAGGEREAAGSRAAGAGG